MGLVDGVYLQLHRCNCGEHVRLSFVADDGRSANIVTTVMQLKQWLDLTVIDVDKILAEQN